MVRSDEAGDLAFEQLFKTHFKGLHTYACTILRDGHLAEEVVQVVFARFYEKMARITIEASVEAYLYRAVYNESLNQRRREKVRREYRKHAERHGEGTSVPGEGGDHRELEARLHQALNELPQQCRTIFQLSRFEELKYREIAHRLDLSVKTVENQMGKALRILRDKLLPYLVVIILFILNKNR
ncbi:RNA polymerase sigma-70 factor [Puia dinghuensis]|uniref:DNA-directed RNA polymerase sigma-70 factor n=1 Tax=Puia dinghuensis TaxID=1792502 RepID=A0A8J2XWA5_9BACT|nr:RNA polymerase sigma-70 factor [Puia dinghuensis]GGB18161.1 DNA-directed RNA polymerase sigma-70 factor [Puia dinghuensis]